MGALVVVVEVLTAEVVLLLSAERQLVLRGEKRQLRCCFVEQVETGYVELVAQTDANWK